MLNIIKHIDNHSSLIRLAASKLHITQVRYRCRRRPRLWPSLKTADIYSDQPYTGELSNPEPPALRFQIRRKKWDINAGGQEKRLWKLRRMVTALVKYERIEGSFKQTSEVRQYADRLIHEAIIHGDKHIKTMEMATYWLEEKDLIYKLFNVLVPRFREMNISFTRMFNLPRELPGFAFTRAVLELRGNPYPSVVPHPTDNSKLLTNVLLSAMRWEYKKRRDYSSLDTLLELGEKDDERGEKDGERGDEVDEVPISPQIIDDVAKMKLKRGEKNIYDVSERITHSIKPNLYKEL